MDVSRRDLLRAAGLAAGGALAGCPGLSGGGDTDATVQWAVTGATASRTFHVPDATVPAEAPSVRWQAPLDGPFGVSVLATGDLALATTPAGVHAVSLADGSIPWRAPFEVTGGGTDTVLTPEGLHVRQFFPNAGRQTSRYGLALDDGSRTYEDTDDYAGSALWAPTDDDLLGLSDAGTVSRYDPAAGAWGEDVVATGGELWGTVTDGERLYVPVNREGSWAVEAYDLATGETDWTYALSWDGAVSMLATGDRLVMTDVPALGGATGARAHDPATGDVVWEFTWNDDAVVAWRGVAAGETVYLLARPAQGDDSGTYRLAAVDLASGDVRFRVDTAMQFPMAATPERVVGTTVTTQFPAPGLVAVEGADGSETWRVEPAGGVEPGIAVSQGVLAFVATDSGRSLALLA